MTGLVGWWPLHENSGSTANDLSGNGNHGTLNGGVTQGVAGKGGLTGYSFNSSNDEFIDFGTNQDFFPDKISISWWVNYDRVDGTRQYWGIDDDTGIRGWNFAIRSDQQTGKFEFDIVDSNVDGISVYNLSSDIWYHIVGTWDNTSGEGQLFINGALEKTANGSTIDNTVDNRMLLGKREYSGNQDNMDAQVSDVRIYNRILSSSEVQTLYKWGNGDYASPPNNRTDSSSAVSRWAFDGDVKDSWGSNDGTDNTSAGYSSNAIRGQAKSFDGSDDYVDSTLGLSGDFAISFWMKLDDLSKEYCPISKDSVIFVTKDYNGDSRFDEMQFGYKDSSGSFNDVRIGPVLPTEWVHIAGVYRSGAGEMYLNGVKKGEISHTYSEQGTDLEIGRYQQSSNREFNGKIDDVRVYSRALQPHEVFQLYQWGTRGRDMRKLTVNSR